MLALIAMNGSTLCPVVHGTNIVGARAKNRRERFVVTSIWRDRLTMMMAICCNIALIGFGHQSWWVSGLVSVAVWVGLRTLWPDPQRGNQREETAKAERSDQRVRASRPRSPFHRPHSGVVPTRRLAGNEDRYPHSPPT